MVFVKDRVGVAVHFQASDVRGKEKSTRRASGICLRKILLTAHFILSFATARTFAGEIVCDQNRPVTHSNQIKTSKELQSHCQNLPQSSLTISGSTPWLQNQTDICDGFTWLDLMQIGDKNISNCSIAINCSEVNSLTQNLIMVSDAFDMFESAVGNFDCSQRYSTKTNCSKCLKSYRQWLCLAQFYKDDTKPCLDVCYRVFRNCPALEPEESFGGYQMFECPHYVDEYSSYGHSSNCVSVGEG